MKKQIKQNKIILKPRFFFLLVIALSLFGFFGFSFLHSSFSPISGAETSSGTVTFTITGSNNAAGGAEEEPGVSRIHGKEPPLSLQLEVVPKAIMESLPKSQGKIIELLFRNRSGDITFSFVLSTDVSLLHISETHIVLPPGAEKKVYLQVDTSAQGMALGRLYAEGQFVFKQIPVFVHVFIPSPYTLSVAIPESKQQILSNEDIFADISFTPLSGGTLDVHYMIKNERNSVILSEQEEVAVTQKTVSFQKTFDLPDNLPLGRYYLIVSSTYNGMPAEEAAAFDVVNSLSPQREYPLQLYSQSPVIFFLIILAILLLHIIMTWHKEKYA